jgi:hypothetical protein
MQYEWWQFCLITISNGISWSLPILTVFLAAAWFLGNVTKEVVEKVKKKVSTEE